jgi:N-methylhydantoinase B
MVDRGSSGEAARTISGASACAWPRADVKALYADTRNNLIEDIETHLPLRVLRYELREDVSGAGKWHGGLGSAREFTFLSDGGASVEVHRYRP